MVTTTPHGRSAQTGPARPRLAQVKLDLIDCPAEVLAGSRRPPDIAVSEESANVIMMLRAPLLLEMKADGQPARYRAIGNVDALRWFMHANALKRHPARHVHSLVLPAGSVTAEDVEAIDRHLVPLALGELSERAARRARRELKARGIALLAPDPTRLLRPLTRP